MALARVAFRKLQQRVAANASSSSSLMMGHGGVEKNQRWGNELVRRFASSTSDSKEGSEVAVSTEGKKKSRLFPRRRGSRRPSWPWRRSDDRDFSPALFEFFPSGLGNALMQATENINRLFEDMNVTPWSLSAQVKEKDDHYKLRYEMPGISKEDVKITIDDGVLNIKGEHKEEKEGGGGGGGGDDDDNNEYWSSYGYYNASLVLPDDAKADEVKAELKDGVLVLTIPRSERPKKDVKQIAVN